MNDNAPTAPLPGHDPQGPNTAAPAPAPAPEKRRRSGLRAALIGGGAGLAVLLVGGIGAGIALSVADDDDDRSALTSSSSDTGSSTRSGPTGSTDDTGSSSAGESGSSAVASDADALVSAIDAAIAAAGGTGATSIEVTREGWEVDVAVDGGSETEVLVAEDGTTTVRTERDDDDTDPQLDTALVADIVDAAIAEAGGGTVSEISTDDDSNHLYDVTVDLQDGGQVDLELADDLSVVEIDRDDD